MPILGTESSSWQIFYNTCTECTKTIGNNSSTILSSALNIVVPQFTLYKPRKLDIQKSMCLSVLENVGNRWRSSSESNFTKALRAVHSIEKSNVYYCI